MKFIYEVLQLNTRNKKIDWLCSVFALIFLFVSWGLVAAIFNGSGLIGIMLFFAGIIGPAIGAILAMELGKKIPSNNVKFEKTKLYKKLEKKGHLHEFRDTIDEEIKLENVVKYSCDITGVGLLVTKTWFIYIHESRPVVAKTKDIVRISEELSTSNSSRYLSVELKNGKYLTIKLVSLEDVESEIKNKYPEIKIG